MQRRGFTNELYFREAYRYIADAARDRLTSCLSLYTGSVHLIFILGNGDSNFSAEYEHFLRTAFLRELVAQARAFHTTKRQGYIEPREKTGRDVYTVASTSS